MEMVILILACVAALTVIEREKVSMNRLMREKTRANRSPRRRTKR